MGRASRRCSGPEGSAVMTVGTMGATAGATGSALDSYTRPAAPWGRSSASCSARTARTATAAAGSTPSWSALLAVFVAGLMAGLRRRVPRQEDPRAADETHRGLRADHPGRRSHPRRHLPDDHRRDPVHPQPRLPRPERGQLRVSPRRRPAMGPPSPGWPPTRRVDGGSSQLAQLRHRGPATLPEQESLADLLADQILVLNRIGQDVWRVRLERAAAQRVSEPFHS